MNGVLYLALGSSIPAVLAVSLRTLRRHWDGPVTVLADAGMWPFITCIAADCDPPIQVVNYQPPPFRAYTVKPHLPKESPYDYTVQVDADTMWVQSPQTIFDLLKPGLCVVTQFSNWVTTGPRMQGRIEEWGGVDPERVAAALAKPWPALNTGMVAYHHESKVAREAWLKQTLKHPKIFISDEIAACLLVPEFGTDGTNGLLVAGDRYNRSLKFPGPDGETVLWHFHGRKHTKDDRMRAVWLPEFEAMWRENWGGVRDWMPQCRDKRLHEWLAAHPIT